MNKKILIVLLFLFIIVNISGQVYGHGQEDYTIYNDKAIQEDINFNLPSNSGTNNSNNNYLIGNLASNNGSFGNHYESYIEKIFKVFVSKSVFKAGTKINLKIYTDKSVKLVTGKISGKTGYIFTKTNSGYWNYNLNTKNFKNGVYIVNITAIDTSNKVYKSLAVLTVDNVPPKLFSVSTNVKSVNAGNQFTVFASADNTTTKIVATIRGQKYSFKYLNGTQWSSKIKLSYKEINTIIIIVKAFDSAGNFAKKDTYIVSKPKIVYWNGSLLTNKKRSVKYPHPNNDYEKSIKELSKYAKVYEGFAVDDRTLGITYRISHGKKVQYAVTIAYKDPFIVYHELAHVLHWKWNEYTCDRYAYNKTGYWIK